MQTGDTERKLTADDPHVVLGVPKGYTETQYAFIVSDIAALLFNGFSTETVTDQLNSILADPYKSNSSRARMYLVFSTQQFEYMNIEQMKEVFEAYAKRTKARLTFVWYEYSKEGRIWGFGLTRREMTFDYMDANAYKTLHIEMFTKEFVEDYSWIENFSGQTLGWAGVFEAIGLSNPTDEYSSDLHSILNKGTWHHQFKARFNRIVVVEQDCNHLARTTYHINDHYGSPRESRSWARTETYRY